MGQPFARLGGLVAALNALLNSGMKYQEAFVRAGLNTYQSRGKGKNKPFVRSHFSKKSRQASRSKYMPHQGKQEVARRMMQDERNSQRRITREAKLIAAMKWFLPGTHPGQLAISEIPKRFSISFDAEHLKRGAA